jgi:hypothetical protein
MKKWMKRSAAASPRSAISLAGRAAQAEAAEIGRCGIGQQDRPHRREDDGERRHLPRECHAADCSESGFEIGQTTGSNSSATVLSRCQNLQDNQQMGVIDRSQMRDTPTNPMAPLMRSLSCLELVSRKPSWPAFMCERTQQAGHMDASDLIKPLQDTLQGGAVVRSR